MKRLCRQFGKKAGLRKEKYKAVSARLHEIWNSYAAALEAIAFDEAYLDITERAGDFAGHPEEIYQMDTLHRTAEYMRKHKSAL